MAEELNTVEIVEEVKIDTLVMNNSNECSEPALKRQRLDSSFVTRVSDSGANPDDLVSELRDEDTIVRDRVSFGASEGSVPNSESALEEIRLPVADLADATPAVVLLPKVADVDSAPLPAVPEAPVEEVNESAEPVAASVDISAAAEADAPAEAQQVDAAIIAAETVEAVAVAEEAKPLD